MCVSVNRSRGKPLIYKNNTATGLTNKALHRTFGRNENLRVWKTESTTSQQPNFIWSMVMLTCAQLKHRLTNSFLDLTLNMRSVLKCWSLNNNANYFAVDSFCLFSILDSDRVFLETRFRTKRFSSFSWVKTTCTHIFGRTLTQTQHIRPWSGDQYRG